MRLPEVLLLLFVSLGLWGCANSARSHAAPLRWTAGFWFWPGGSTNAGWSGQPLDVLFVHVGVIRQEEYYYGSQYPAGAPKPWYAFGDIPKNLPLAREYWLVFRYEKQGVPDLAVVPVLSRTLAQLRAAAVKRQIHVTGVQLDIDSPTSALPQYAAFLGEVRKGLPAGWGISITALLDWFRSGTSIADVVRQVDEFVPQFYDVSGPASGGDRSAIAAKIDAARWGPIFNRFGKRFRIGISTFGRSRLVRNQAAKQTGYYRLTFFGDLTPIDIATNPAFQLEVTRNEAGELVLSYQAKRKYQIGYQDFQPGDVLQFLLSTPESVSAAVDSARRMAGRVAGAVFFRWPGSHEALAMQPDEVLAVSGFTARPATPPKVVAIDAGCAAVRCMDVYLESLAPFSPQPLRFRIRSSAGLEYFLPEPNMPVRMAAPSDLEVSLPPYCGRGRLYLGRAVASGPTTLTLEASQ